MNSNGHKNRYLAYVRDTLPDSLSGLLKVAIHDTRAVLDAPSECLLMVDMWHRPDYEKQLCMLCVAGAVMRGTLRASDADLITPDAYSETISRKLYAIDKLRQRLPYDARLMLNTALFTAEQFDALKPHYSLKRAWRLGDLVWTGNIDKTLDILEADATLLESLGL